MSTSEPGQCVGMIARVRGPMRAATAAELDVARDEIAVDEHRRRADCLTIMLSDGEEALRRR